MPRRWSTDKVSSKSLSVLNWVDFQVRLRRRLCAIVHEGVTGSIPVSSTTQSSRTVKAVGYRKEPVSAGILLPIAGVSGLCREWWSLRRILGLQSLHPKIPFPQLELQDELPSQRSGFDR